MLVSYLVRLSVHEKIRSARESTVQKRQTPQHLKMGKMERTVVKGANGTKKGDCTKVHSESTAN